MHWRSRYLWREAVRNAFTTPRGVAAVFAGGLLAILAVVLLRADLATFDAAQQARYMRGTQVFTITAPRADGAVLLSRSSCERIADDPRIVRAGVAESAGNRYIPQLGRRAQIVRVSSSLVPEAYETGSAIGEHISPGGSRVNIGLDENVLHAVTLPPLPEGVDLNSAIVVPLPPQQTWVTTCVVVARPGADMAQVAASAVSRLTTRGHAAPAVLFTEQDAEDHVTAYAQRATPAIVIGSGVLAGILLAVLVRTRREEFGVYRLAGTTGRELTVIVVAECAFASAGFALAGTLGALALEGPTVTAASHALVVASAALAMFATGGCLGALQLRGDPTRMLADR